MEYDWLHFRSTVTSVIIFSILSMLPVINARGGINASFLENSFLENMDIIIFPASIFMPKLSGSAMFLSVALYTSGQYLLLILLVNYAQKTSNAARMNRYKKNSVYVREIIRKNRTWKIYILILKFISFISIIFAISIVLNRQVDSDAFWLAVAVALIGQLWFATILSVCFAVLSTPMRHWRSPQTGLIRALIDAYDAIEGGGARGWWSIARRSEAAAHLGTAAAILEGPMLRAFTRAGGEALVRPHFEAAAGELRAKVAWLATPMADTRGHLVREIGTALLAAAVGDLHRLGHNGEIIASPIRARISWAARATAFMRWATVALGPGIALVLTIWIGGPQYKPSDIFLAIWVQFAALSFVVASFSAVDPQGRDKLGAVVSTGTAMFGWGKPPRA